jgi:hypothetical protein
MLLAGLSCLVWPDVAEIKRNDQVLFTRLGLMIHHLRFESSAELIRLTETLTRLATDSGE